MPDAKQRLVFKTSGRKAPSDKAMAKRLLSSLSQLERENHGAFYEKYIYRRATGPLAGARLLLNLMLAFEERFGSAALKVRENSDPLQLPRGSPITKESKATIEIYKPPLLGRLRRQRQHVVGQIDFNLRDLALVSGTVSRFSFETMQLVTQFNCGGITVFPKAAQVAPATDFLDHLAYILEALAGDLTGTAKTELQKLIQNLASDAYPGLDAASINKQLDQAQQSLNMGDTRRAAASLSRLSRHSWEAIR